MTRPPRPVCTSSRRDTLERSDEIDSAPRRRPGRACHSIAHFNDGLERRQHWAAPTSSSQKCQTTCVQTRRLHGPRSQTERRACCLAQPGAPLLRMLHRPPPSLSTSRPRGGAGAVVFRCSMPLRHWPMPPKRGPAPLRAPLPWCVPSQRTMALGELANGNWSKGGRSGPSRVLETRASTASRLPKSLSPTDAGGTCAQYKAAPS